MMATRVFWFLASFLVMALFVVAWQAIADARLVSPAFLPGPDRAWQALVTGLGGGDLLAKLSGTLVRMFYGWIIASILGIAIGALIGMSPTAKAYLGPSLEFLRPLPASAVIPLAIALMGLTEAMILSVIAFGALWPMLLATVHGFSAVEPRLYEVARALDMSRLKTAWKIALPNAMPDILSGLRIGLTTALILTVVGEMLTSRDGLGHWILLAARSFRSADLFAGVILLGLIGYLTSALLAAAERHALRWRTAGR